MEILEKTNREVILWLTNAKPHKKSVQKLINKNALCKRCRSKLFIFYLPIIIMR